MRLKTIIAVAAFTIIFSSLLLAASQESSKATVTITPAGKDANQPGFPYSAEVVGNAVFTRAGAGINSYRCGQLNSPDKVVVVEEDPSGWAKVVPPAGSFSWICKQNVTITPAAPDTASVTIQPTRIWAGSMYYDPMYSNELQIKLNIGDKVKLLGEEVGDYYKIVPPAGAYLWVSTQYIKKVGAATTVAGTVPGTAVTEGNPKEKEKLAEYRKLAAKLDAERSKPIAQQNYAEFKTAFEAMSKDTEAGMAAKYAATQLKLIERFEAAAMSSTDNKQQDQTLAELRAKLDSEAQAKMAEVPDMGKYAIIGVIKPSLAYGTTNGMPRRFLVLDDSGKIVSYAQPAASAQGMDLSELYGKKVGIIGAISQDTSSMPLVTFTGVEIPK
jgi:hypothetical protein